MLLEGKIAIVTGAGRGIGRAIALTFAREGADVVIAELVGDRANQVAGEVRALGRRALVVETDVRQEESAAAMVQRTLKAFGTIDILVINAGITARYFVHEHPTDEFRKVIDTNLVGAFFCCKAVLPTMYEKRDGNIIFINSRSGQRATAFNAAYIASKFGQVGLMQCLALESREHGVRVNAVSPGGVKTELAKAREANGSLLDSSGFMDPQEIADGVLFLATPQSRGMHGQTLTLYGGLDYRPPASLQV